MVLKLPEQVSAKEARSLMRELQSELRLDRPRIVVDFSEVEHIDSTGLDMLLDCMVEVARRDGTVKLGEVSPEAAIVLELTGMDRVFQMFPAVSEAAATFSVARAEAVADEAPQPAAA